MSYNPFYEQIPLDVSKTYIAREFITDDLTYPFHHHPFFEINYVVHGSGQRIVGQKITEFKDCDLTLIAPNLPHQFKNSVKPPTEKIHSIIVQFHPSVFGNEFIERSETVEIKALLKKAKRGLTFGKAVIQKLDADLKNLLSLKGFEGVIVFIRLLNELARTKNFKYLSEINWEENITGKGKDLTDKVFQFIFNHFTEEIKLEQVAEIAGISKSAFSHYFKKRTGKTYSEFINDLRISHALKLLSESEKSISEICYASGFGNLSYFNRVFLKIQGQTPKVYRNNLKINPT